MLTQSSNVVDLYSSVHTIPQQPKTESVSKKYMKVCQGTNTGNQWPSPLLSVWEKGLRWNNKNMGLLRMMKESPGMNTSNQFGLLKSLNSLHISQCESLNSLYTSEYESLLSG